VVQHAPPRLRTAFQIRAAGDLINTDAGENRHSLIGIRGEAVEHPSQFRGCFRMQRVGRIPRDWSPCRMRRRGCSELFTM
jgi:hypothetical protein